MARASKNFVEKKLEAVSTNQMAEKDPMHHIDLELSATLLQMFEEAKQGGFKGDMNDYLDSLSMDELRRIGSKDGGSIKAKQITDRHIKNAIKKLKKKGLL